MKKTSKKPTSKSPAKAVTSSVAAKKVSAPAQTAAAVKSATVKKNTATAKKTTKTVVEKNILPEGKPASVPVSTAAQVAEKTAEKIQEIAPSKPAAPADTPAAAAKTPQPKIDDTPRMTPSTPIAKNQPASTASPSSSMGLVAALALILAGLAVAGCAYMWQRMGSMQEALQANIDNTTQTATNAQNVAEKFLGNANSLEKNMGLLNSKLDALDSEERVKTLLKSLEKYQNAAAAPLFNNLPVHVRSIIATAEIQTELSGSTQPLLTALQLVEKQLTDANFSADGALRNAIATDIKNIQDIPAPDPLGVANKVSELLSTFNDPNVKLPMLNEVRTKDPGINLDIDVDLESGLLAIENAETPGIWGKIKSAWRWTADKVSYVAKAVWDQLGSLVRITPIESKDAVLLSARDGALLKEGIKLHLMGIRLSVLQRQFTQAQKELQEVQTSLNHYFDTNNAEVKEVLRQTNVIITDLNNVSIPKASATSSALAAIQSNQ